MSEEPKINYVFMWHCLSDACEKCRSLNGREWREQDLFKEVLWDMFYGDIWDLNANHSLAHPNCRCQLEVRVESVDLERLDGFATLKELKLRV